MFCDDDAFNYFNVNFELSTAFGFSITELENFLPYEREIYVSLVIQEQQRKENERRQ